MAMSKKDFWAIANAVADTKRWVAEDNGAALAVLGVAARQLASACARQYRGGYGFNRSKFLEACGFPDE
jgi:hypothetical protein